jgi:hypothetical protein
MKRPSNDTLRMVAMVGVGGFVAWWLYEQIAKVGAAGQKVGDAIAAPIADAWLAVTLPGQVNVTGTVLLPNGAGAVPMSQLAVNADLKFKYMGVVYQLTGRDGNNYNAVRA